MPVNNGQGWIKLDFISHKTQGDSRRWGVERILCSSWHYDLWTQFMTRTVFPNRTNERPVWPQYDQSEGSDDLFLCISESSGQFHALAPPALLSQWRGREGPGLGTEWRGVVFDPSTYLMNHLTSLWQRVVLSRAVSIFIYFYVQVYFNKAKQVYTHTNNISTLIISELSLLSLYWTRS